MCQEFETGFVSVIDYKRVPVGIYDYNDWYDAVDENAIAAKGCASSKYQSIEFVAGYLLVLTFLNT